MNRLDIEVKGIVGRWLMLLFVENSMNQQVANILYEAVVRNRFGVKVHLGMVRCSGYHTRSRLRDWMNKVGCSRTTCCYVTTKG